MIIGSLVDQLCFRYFHQKTQESCHDHQAPCRSSIFFRNFDKETPESCYDHKATCRLGNFSLFHQEAPGR
jgi:hypothetical protein